MSPGPSPMTISNSAGGATLSLVEAPVETALPKERAYTRAIAISWSRIGYSQFLDPVEAYPWGGRSHHIAWRIVVSNYIEPEDVLRAVWVRELAVRANPDGPGKWDARDAGMWVIGDLLRARSKGRWQDEISELAAKLPSLVDYMDQEWGEATRAMLASRRRDGMHAVLFTDEGAGEPAEHHERHR